MEQPEGLESVLADVLDARLESVHTAIPGRVEKYYPEDQTADIKPMIKRVLLDENDEYFTRSYPILPRIPVAAPRGGGFFVHFPLAAGDFVFVLFCEASIDQWRAKAGRETHPGDLRRHALGNAVALPCLYPTAGKLAAASAHATNLVIGKDGGSAIHIQPGASGEIRLGSASETSYVALAEKVDDFISRIHGVLSSWVFVAQDGGAALQAAYNLEFPTPPVSTAATKVTAL